MNLSKNLVVALIALSCYVRCNNINLANNTTILLIVLALLAKGNFDISDIIGGGTDSASGRSTATCPYQNGNSNNNTRTIYTTPYAQSGYAYGYNNYPYTTVYQTTVPANNGYGCPCSCNNVVY